MGMAGPAAGPKGRWERVGEGRHTEHHVRFTCFTYPVASNPVSQGEGSVLQ